MIRGLYFKVEKFDLKKVIKIVHNASVSPFRQPTLPHYYTNLPNKKNIHIYHAQTDM